MTPAPDWLTSPEARACFQRVQSKLLTTGQWRPDLVLGLTPLAAQCAHYVRASREARALKEFDPDAMRNFQDILEESRLVCRKFLADFLVIRHDRVRLTVMNAEGLDADIATLCAPLQGGPL